MIPIRFPSVLNPTKVGYEWTNDSMTFWDTAYHSVGVLHCSAGFYETFGDGNCQHTPLTACRANQMTDFCLSLARYLLANPAEEFQTYALQLKPCSRETVLFLAGINYKEAKRQWFNLTDNKLSTSDSKRHDKRWHEVPSWADGTVASAIQLFSLAKNGRYEVLNLFAMHEFFLSAVNGLIWKGTEWDKLTAYQTKIPGDFTAAFRALSYVVEARENLNTAKRMAECCEHNSRIIAERAA